MSHPVTDLVAYFEGPWSLDREITDASGAPVGAFTGTARFTASAGVLDYREDGELRMGAHRGPAHRALRYVLTGPGQAEVYFDYGDFFHLLDLRTGAWDTSHPCRDDLYRGQFRILGPHRWTQSWQVRGPTKDHALHTRFERAHTARTHVTECGGSRQ